MVGSSGSEDAEMLLPRQAGPAVAVDAKGCGGGWATVAGKARRRARQSAPYAQAATATQAALAVETAT
eukprot:9907621-Lingulodinium_polyedra.AAC.1